MCYKKKKKNAVQKELCLSIPLADAAMPTISPWQSWVCSSKKCQDCWGDGPNKDCVIATSAPGRIHLVMQYSNITLVEGDITVNYVFLCRLSDRLQTLKFCDIDFNG
ncbi:hypothetical protein DPMN_017993 [Dreissena polymorpha]|uniref:Uncharacterized protein n=1 Tax=Dreissena polymorpha TaxID=45954 RepID=A0A9D4NFR8_DREPO|nr:hypothetical protein DPMN_017993 [Dreissena polymorpha]